MSSTTTGGWGPSYTVGVIVNFLIPHVPGAVSDADDDDADEEEDVAGVTASVFEADDGSDDSTRKTGSDGGIVNGGGNEFKTACVSLDRTGDTSRDGWLLLFFEVTDDADGTKVVAETGYGMGTKPCDKAALAAANIAAATAALGPLKSECAAFPVGDTAEATDIPAVGCKNWKWGGTKCSWGNKYGCCIC